METANQIELMPSIEIDCRKEACERGGIANRYSGACISALLAISVMGVAQAAPQQCADARTAPSPTPPAHEPKAVAVLKAASAILAEAKTMSFTAVETYERPALNGQPLYYSKLNEVTVQRPNKLRVITSGDVKSQEFYYDGQTMMAYKPSHDLVAIADAPGTIDGLLDVAWETAAIYFPFADVISSDAYDETMETMTSAFYVGQSKIVAGTVTDRVAVANGNVQAEIWIGAADHLPRLMRVVYPRQSGGARYQIEFSDWHLGIAVPPDTFTSEKALHAKHVPFEPPGSAEPPIPGDTSQLSLEMNVR
jgi:hypothetical protein